MQLVNRPPTAPTVDVTPDSPLTTDDLVCTITIPSTDPDGDPVSYSYAWYKNGALQSALTTNIVSASETAKGETWRCVVTPNDGTMDGPSAQDEVTIVPRVWHVDDDKQDYPDADFTKIQDAVDAASAGDTIFVYEGTYHENIVIHKSLSLIGKDRNTTVIDANGVKKGILVDNVWDSIRCSIEGFTIRNSGEGYSGGIGNAGIVLHTWGKGIFEITNNILIDNPGMAGGILTDSKGTISGNMISASPHGIFVTQGCNNTIIIGNSITNCGVGVYVHWQSNAIQIINNTIAANQSGVFLGPPGNLTYLNNFIDNQDNVSSNSLNTWHSPEEITYTYNGKTYTNYLGNYWSDYPGGDANGDGIGDTPYSIDGDKDSYPLIGVWKDGVIIPPPNYGVDLSWGEPEKRIGPGETASYTLTVKNTGNRQDTFDLTCSDPPSGWIAILDENSVILDPEASTDITLRITAPYDAQDGDKATITVIATSQGDSSKRDSIIITTTIGKNWLTGWKYREKLSIDHTKIDADLTDFPVAVFLNSSNFDFSKARSDGFDIRFTSSDGVTLLKYERERHDAINQKAVYHVKIPFVSSTTDTEFYLYYGNPNASNGVDPASVWDSNFKGVWHLNQDPSEVAPQILDSTANNNNGTCQGSMALDDLVEGKIGQCLEFDGSDNYINLPTSFLQTGANPWTIEGWCYATDSDERYIWNAGPWKGGQVIYLGQHGKYLVGWYSGGFGDDALVTNTWKYLTATYDGTTVRLYVDGVSSWSEDATLNLQQQDCWIGARNSDGGAVFKWSGKIDEIRYSRVCRSDAWLKASYHSGNNTLLTYEGDGPGVVTGIVRLQGRNDHSGATISIPGYEPVVTDAAGNFSLTVDPGTYEIQATMLGYLKAVKSDVVVESGSTTTLPDVTLLGGDVNGDLVIDISDLATIASQFNIVVSGETVDVTANGMVDVYDLVLVGMNFYRTRSPWAPPGKIAFVSERDGNPEIYVMNADGSNQTRLTNNPERDRCPAWSPDGGRMSFTRGYTGIYVMDSSGQNEEKLISRHAGWAAVWSPDGSRIAFDSGVCGQREIYVMDADGANLTRLTNNSANDSHPAWSPDGSQIVFQSDRDGRDSIYVMNSDGSDQRPLTDNLGNDGQPAWSPDGRFIAFQSDRGGARNIWIMDADGGNLRMVTNFGYGWYPRDATWPSWSPDGSQIAFYAWVTQGNTEIYVIDADGTNLMRLTRNSAPDWGPTWWSRPSKAAPILSSPSHVAGDPSTDGKMVELSGQTYLTGSAPRLLIDGKGGVNIAGNIASLQKGFYRLTGVYDYDTNTLDVYESVKEEVKYLAIKAGKELDINLVPVAVKGLIATPPREVANTLTSYLSIPNSPKDVPIYPYVVYAQDGFYLALSDTLVHLPAEVTLFHEGEEYSFTFSAGQVKGTLLKTPLEEIELGSKWQPDEFGGVIIAENIQASKPTNATVQQISNDPASFAFKRVRIHGTYVVATATVDYSELKMPFGVGILADSPIELFFEEKGPRLETIDPERKVWQLRQAEVIGTVLYPTEEVLKYLDYSAPLSGQEVKAGVKPALIVDTLVDEVVAVANISELNPVTGNPRQYWGKVVEFDGYALGVNIRLKDVVEAIAQTEIPINVNMLAIGIADSPALGSQLAIIGLNNELLDKGGETIVGRFMFRVAVSEMPIKLVDIESADTAFFLLSREELPIKIPTEL